MLNVFKAKYQFLIIQNRKRRTDRYANALKEKEDDIRLVACLRIPNIASLRVLEARQAHC
jgi:hypothetical protein